MANWRDGWACFSPARESEEADQIVELLMKDTIQQHWWTSYGSTRSILATMGLDTGKPQVFHKTKYVGSTVEEVQTYIYTLKRIHGEL